jgi:hypothetical protein
MNRASTGLESTIVHLIVKISPGEFLDKLAILEIKAERVQDPRKRAKVLHELESLRADWAAGPPSPVDIEELRRELKAVNEALWEIEDRIRIKESEGTFDEEFIRLARSVYQTNDRRSAIKHQLNVAMGSDLQEVKSYTRDLGPS